jgi:hypothetical protein
VRLRETRLLTNAGRQGGEGAEKEKAAGSEKTMLCVDFENLLTDYIEGVVGPETNRLMAEHAMKCPCAMKLCWRCAARSRLAERQPCLRLRENWKLVFCKRQCRTRRWVVRNLKSVLLTISTVPAGASLSSLGTPRGMCDRCTELPGEVVEPSALATRTFPKSDRCPKV